MTGWLILTGVGSLVLLLLWRPGRLDKSALMLAAAALFIAAAGYAWQGNPGQAGAPAIAKEHKAQQAETLFAIERKRFLNHYGEADQFLGTADAMNRMGKDDYAAGFMRAAVGKYPRNPDLWIGYAHALFILADGNMTPAVTLALDRAQAIEPDSPAPRYFTGLMAIERGDMVSAEQQWRTLYETLPAGSPWRQPLGQRLTMFDMMRAQRMSADGN